MLQQPLRPSYIDASHDLRRCDESVQLRPARRQRSSMQNLRRGRTARERRVVLVIIWLVATIPSCRCQRRIAHSLNMFIMQEKGPQQLTALSQQRD